MVHQLLQPQGHTMYEALMLGKVVHGTKPGAKPYLNREEEKDLAEFIIVSASVGYGKTRAQIMSLAENAAGF